MRRYGQGAPDALVLLPGAQMHPADVESGGLPALMPGTLDLIVPDLHLDPTGRSDAVQRLAHEVLAPLAGRYRHRWLAGISLGGLLALRYAQIAGDGLRGLCLLAPYPGSRLVTNHIARAGGLQAWQPTPAQLADPEYALWVGLRAGQPRLPTFIGWGRADRFAAGMAAVADLLPQAARREADGGHDWAAWRPLWRDALAWIAEETA
ncbi:MAG: hypothetical protein QM740_14200 [Acidovorax sp.]